MPTALSAVAMPKPSESVPRATVARWLVGNDRLEPFRQSDLCAQRVPYGPLTTVEQCWVFAAWAFLATARTLTQYRPRAVRGTTVFSFNLRV